LDNGIRYSFAAVAYPNGTLEIYTDSSRTPFKLENDADRVNLIAWIGRIRCELEGFTSEIQPVSEWYLSQCDLNKDIRIGDQFHFNNFNVQIKHLDQMFSIYVKSMGGYTVCRVEKQLKPKMPILEFIDNALTPAGELKDRIAALETIIQGTVNN
jgi:hypothetical protein